MKKLYFLLIGGLIMASSNFAQAQTTHDVVVTNGFFTPPLLEIEQGDIVRWTNEEGFHGVDGNETNFPTNPVSFGNDNDGAGWVYEFTFDVEGAYAYRCGVHTTTMFGAILVGDLLSVSETDGDQALDFYPNPIVDQLKWKSNTGAQASNQILRMFDITGKIVTEINLATASQLDVTSFKSGMYFYSVTENKTVIQTGKFLIAQ